MHYPLISVIVPVYNVEPYLRRCLDSIIEQTYQNLEIIIVASPSPDNSVGICEEYKTRDARIVLICSEPKGLSDARNRGIDAAHGKYFSFIDGDDYIAPDFISTLYSICVNHHCDIAQCNELSVNESDTTIYADSPKEITVSSGRDMCVNLCVGYPTWIANVVTWDKLYNRELFASVRFPVGRIHEDEATTYRLFYSAQKVGFTTQKLYFYRHDVSTSILGRNFSLARLDGLKYLEERVHFFEEHEESELQALALFVYAKEIPIYIAKLKENVPGSEDIQKQLKEKAHSALVEILNNPHLSLMQKGIATLYCKIPHMEKILRNQRMEILKKLVFPLFFKKREGKVH